MFFFLHTFHNVENRILWKNSLAKNWPETDWFYCPITGAASAQTGQKLAGNQNLWPVTDEEEVALPTQDRPRALPKIGSPLRSENIHYTPVETYALWKI